MSSLTLSLSTRSESYIHWLIASKWFRHDFSTEVRGLNDDIVNLKTSFLELLNVLERHDREARHSGPGVAYMGLENSDARPLAPQWTEINERFSTLVDYSREIAEHAYNHLKQHVQITFAIGPSQLHDCDTIKTNVDGFISSFDEQANEYALCERALSNLVERARHLEGATGRIISPVLKATYEEVQALRDRLSHATKEITEVGVACLAWFPAELWPLYSRTYRSMLKLRICARRLGNAENRSRRVSVRSSSCWKTTMIRRHLRSCSSSVS
ncbi:hypothetical protein C8Q70DRAFT_951790 [Cubamyces menziesii]|nr:hypothetical protein C8Q70DRAFT_951790 [Cubamyces menziesii]